MVNNTVKFAIQLDGNAHEALLDLDDVIGKVQKSIKKTTSIFDKLGKAAFHFDVISNTVTKFSEGINSAIEPGIKLNTSLQDLSAITGITGKGLKEIEGYARESAKAFGVDAAGAVESYKLVLSQLSPEIAKTPVALKAMGDSISTLSKTMGGDTTAAAEVLTTAMNQFQVSTADPIAASKEMARMMNVMAAAAKEGSAELPQIKQALEQSGMAAKGAGVSFEEANAAIQVLDKAGKKGAEGGVALRNVMNIVARGRFLPKDVQDELQAVGVDINSLSDKSKTLTERLKPLQSVMGDSALFSKLFGMENANAAMALVQGIDEVDRYKEAITGTNTAYEQAETVMESYAEKQARIQAKFDDLKISIFNATGDFGIWTQVLASAMVPLAQLMPLIMGAGKAFTYMKEKVITTSFALNEVKKSINRVGIAAKITCKAIGDAIKSIPVLGWIAAIVAVVIAAVKLLWDKSEGFRRLVMGVCESIKAIANNIWVVLKTVFEKIWEGVTWLYEGAVSIFTAIGEFFVNIWSWVTDTVSNAFNWIVAKLGVVATWIKEKLVDPIRNAFANVWEFIKGIFDKIIAGLGRLFAPIKALWNKIFPKDKFKDVSAAYATGAEKGSESWRKSKIEGEVEMPSTSVLGGTETPKPDSIIPEGTLKGGNMGGSAGTSAGKAQQISIKLDSMIGTMNFNGGLRENAHDVEAQLTEMMARILGMAETSI